MSLRREYASESPGWLLNTAFRPRLPESLIQEEEVGPHRGPAWPSTEQKAMDEATCHAGRKARPASAPRLRKPSLSPSRTIPERPRHEEECGWSKLSGPRRVARSGRHDTETGSFVQRGRFHTKASPLLAELRWAAFSSLRWLSLPGGFALVTPPRVTSTSWVAGEEEGW